MNDEMVRALLREDKPKTEFRRAIICVRINTRPERWDFVTETTNHMWEFEWVLSTGRRRSALVRCPFGVRGDILWVREAYRSSWHVNQNDPMDEYVNVKDCAAYRSTGTCMQGNAIDPTGAKWTTSIFMPRKYSRFLLQIVELYPQRIQEISEREAEREGFLEKIHEDCGLMTGISARERFFRFWDTTIGKQFPISLNPWVWVIKFNLIKVTNG